MMTESAAPSTKQPKGCMRTLIVIFIVGMLLCVMAVGLYPVVLNAVLTLTCQPEGDLMLLDASATDALGTAPVNLTNTPEYEGAPQWSPDGKHIFYMSGGHFYRLSVDTLEAEQLGRMRFTSSRVAWSPDREWLAARIQGGERGYNLVLVRTDGSQTIRLTNDAMSNDFPTWSPDGRHLAFTSYDNRLNIPADTTYIFMVTMPTDPQSTEVIINQIAAIDSLYVYDLTWSPDGEYLAFSESLAYVKIMRPDGTDGRLVTRGNEVVWSPTSTHIATRGQNIDARGSYDYPIVVADLNGSLTRVAPQAQTASEIIWSPDGTRLAFFDPAGQINVVNADGTEPYMLTDETEASLHSLAWSPDGKHILYVRSHSKCSDLHL